MDRQDQDSLIMKRRAPSPPPSPSPQLPPRRRRPAPASPQPGRTLLPGPLAQAVSFATRSTSLAIRVGSTAGSYGLDAAKFTTLSSLELARGVIEGVLSRAGRDTLARSSSDLAKIDAESVIERSLENLHQAMTQVVFWTTAGFHFTSATVAMASDFSQLFLSSLDQVLGSTDSSRAIASIVTLIRRELRDPATGRQGEKVGVVDLVLGLCALAFLQQRCWRFHVEEQRRHGREEIIWDVVVLSDGERIDVEGHRSSPDTLASRADNLDVVSLRPPQGNQDAMEDDEDAILHKIKQEIIQSLPPDTTVSISNSVSTTQTITVDVDGPGPTSIPSLPGAEIVEARVPPSLRSLRAAEDYDCDPDPSYRIIYRLENTRVGNTSFRNREDSPPIPTIELPDLDPPDNGEPFSDTNTHQTSHGSSRFGAAVMSPPSRASPTPETKGMSKESLASSQRAARRGQSLTHGEVKSIYTNKNAQSPTPAKRPNPESEANQKKRRVPLNPLPLRTKSEPPQDTTPPGKRSSMKRKTESPLQGKSGDKKGTLRQALKEGSQSFSNIWHRDQATDDAKSQPRWRETGNRSSSDTSRGKAASATGTALTSQALKAFEKRSAAENDAELRPRSSSRASYVSIQERDTYSVLRTGGSRPQSPSCSRLDAPGEMSPKPSYPDGSMLRPRSPSAARHRRNHSHVPSLYSLASNDSQSSLVLASYYQKSAYSAADALTTLRRDGILDGIFPRAHILRNITRYMRFSSASYGSNFLKVLGISKKMPSVQAWDGLHSDVRHFVHHTESDANSLLLASFVDPQGGSDSSGSTGTGVPMVHYISLDHEAKAVVLACRGTLGFEDVLADLTCEYDMLTWQGRGYRVHKGVHASARRLLCGDDGRILVTLREALLEFPDYGVILCGHSLGGAVTALLGVMLAEPNPTGTGFVTAAIPQVRLLGEQFGDANRESSCGLPPNRPIHVYAYGPPGTMSSSLRKRTKGLITSVVHGNDIVPCLSLGVLHDFQAVALAFKDDQHEAKMEIRQRLWQTLQGGIADKWYSKTSASPRDDDLEWGLPVLEVLRASMTNETLVPPGEVFAVESQRVLRRDAFLRPDEDHIGRPAQRIVLKYIKDVEARFKEIRFGTSMLIDHSPAKYEEALNKLRLGVV